MIKEFKKLIFIISFLLIIPLTVMASEPTDRIKAVSEELISILSDNEFQSPDIKGERDQMILEAVEGLFNWEEISKRSLARNWTKRSDKEKEEFVSLFKQLVERTYLDKISQYSGEKVVFLEEQIEGDYGKVTSNFITSTGTQIPVDYRLIKKDGSWRIYDIYIEGVSLVNNYRSQFNGILANSSYEELVRRLKENLEKGE